MRHATSRIVSLSLIVLLVFSALSLTLTVFADSRDCQVPSQYTTIGAAYAAGCSRILVAPGTYAEQLTITTPVTIQGSGPQTIIRPASVIENAPASDEAAVIAVIGTAGVSITNLVVDGSAAATHSSPLFTSCAGPYYGGILFSDASGSIRNTQVENLYQSSPSLYGCQSDAGLAIDVESATGTSVVSIDNNVATNYQKNGITCDGTGSTCEISNDVTSPLPAATSTTGDATNGIQVAFGATATVSNNQVSGNECNVALCGSHFTDPAGTNLENDASGILLDQAGDGTTVQNNHISSCDLGMEVYGTGSPGGVQLQSNQLTDNRYAGMTIENGAFTVQDTQISSSATGAVAIGVFALVSQSDSSSSVTLQNLHSSLPYFTYATGSLTAYIYLSQQQEQH